MSYWNSNTIPAPNCQISEDLGLTNRRFTNPRSNEPRSNDPRSNDPRTNDPRSNDPRSNDPRSNDPRSNDPRSTYPRSTYPRSTYPGSTNARSTYPGSTNARSTYPGSTYPGSTNARSTYPGSTYPGSYTVFNPYPNTRSSFHPPQFTYNYNQNIPMNYYNTTPNLESQRFNNISNNNTDGNQANAYGFGSNGSSSHLNLQNSSTQVKESKLTPTAEEFRPRNMRSYNSESATGSGTVKKRINYSKNKKQNQNGNEPWPAVVSSKHNTLDKHENQNYYKQKRRGYGNKNNEQDRTLEEAASSLYLAEEKPKETEAQLNDRFYDAHKMRSFAKNSHNWNSNKNGDYSYKKNGRNKYEKKYEARGKENWRQNMNAHAGNWSEVKAASPWEFKKKFDAASQRERLVQMVERRLLECLICCEHFRHSDSIWSCKQCYHIIHLNCIIRWAKTSKLETGWRCPACQNVNSYIPNEYRCFCDKTLNPHLEFGTLPHSCGKLCGRQGRSCKHTCTLLCHPGPCPECNTIVPKLCGCGSTTQITKCNSEVPVICQNICGKLLECSLHNCSSVCHVGKCGDCIRILKQECYCGKVGRKVRCTFETKGSLQYECGEVCGKVLSCGNHHCEALCHPGECSPCRTSPMVITNCPCGQMKLSIKRKSCLDSIPCCDKICNKTLRCGQPNAPHQCQKKCHKGKCPPCLLTTSVLCRCGHMDKEIACSELKTKADDARCQKKCTKLRLCYKHKCNQMCCIEVEHVCPLPCNRVLSCGLHRCEETCHQALCPPCWQTSFEELYCECGASVLYPPVACGTRPPPCDKPCSRQRNCGHDANHNCHTGACPPCTVMTKRWCHGRHEQRSTILCCQSEFSCGLPCGKEMFCGRHRCIQPCHSGPCPFPCAQPCTIIRQTCEHICSQPCHEPPCPETPCKQTVHVTCQCRQRSSIRSCVELTSEYQSIAMSHLASKMAAIQKGQVVDISDIVSGQKKHGTLKALECNEDCRLFERNRRMAMALQIRNPDLSAKLTPRYSDFMKSWGKKDSRFCQHVHDKLTELVHLAKQSKQKSRSHSFDSMNKDKRHFVHEYCEHFGCESEAYDAEPNRNVVATASRDKSWLPSISLLEFLQRENGQRKVPGPMVGNKMLSRPAKPPTPPGEHDYFDDPPVMYW